MHGQPAVAGGGSIGDDRWHSISRRRISMTGRNSGGDVAPCTRPAQLSTPAPHDHRPQHTRRRTAGWNLDSRIVLASSAMPGSSPRPSLCTAQPGSSASSLRASRSARTVHAATRFLPSSSATDHASPGFWPAGRASRGTPPCACRRRQAETKDSSSRHRLEVGAETVQVLLPEVRVEILLTPVVIGSSASGEVVRPRKDVETLVAAADHLHDGPERWARWCAREGVTVGHVDAATPPTCAATMA